MNKEGFHVLNHWPAYCQSVIRSVNQKLVSAWHNKSCWRMVKSRDVIKSAKQVQFKSAFKSCGTPDYNIYCVRSTATGWLMFLITLALVFCGITWKEFIWSLSSIFFIAYCFSYVSCLCYGLLTSCFRSFHFFCSFFFWSRYLFVLFMIKHICCSEQYLNLSLQLAVRKCDVLP